MPIRTDSPAAQFSLIVGDYYYQCTVRVYSFEEFAMQKLEPADIWLTNFMLETLTIPAVIDWLTSTSTFNHLPPHESQLRQQMIVPLLNDG